MGIYENFTTWIESDAFGRLSRTAPRSTWTGLLRSDSSTWTRKDFGTGFFINFTHEFELVVIAGTGRTSSQTWRCCPYVVSNNLSHRSSLNTAIALTLEQDTVETPVGKDYSVFIEEFNGGTNYKNEAAGKDFNYGVTYYVRLIRSGVNITVYYYTDAARTILYGSQSMVLHATPAYRYLMVPDSLSASGSQYTDGYVQNLNLGLAIDASQELRAIFQALQNGAAELKAVFKIAQGTVDLAAEFRLRQENLGLPAVFKIIKDAQANLFAKFETSTINATPINSWGTLYIRQLYNISTAKGIGFYWWGAGGWDQLNEFILETPTGFYRGYFADGEAKWNWVFFKIANLEKLAIDGSEPDPTNITGILWTYHSNGLRRVAFLSIWYVEPPDLKGIFTVRHLESLELPAEFTVRYPESQDLKAEFILRQETADLKAEFILRQLNFELKAVFQVREIIEIYEINGTSGTYNVLSTEAPIPEMTKTLSLLTGDKIIVIFQADYWIGAMVWCDTAIRAAGTKISNDVRWGNYSASFSMTYNRYGVIVKATYIAVADGDITFDIVAKSNVGGTAPWIYNARKLTLIHIH